MNLIQQLQATPKWKEFEEWYKDRYMYGKGTDHVNNVLFEHKIKHQHFDEWKGVFEKFIESQGYKIITHVEKGTSYYSLYRKGEVLSYGSDSFEKLLIWYFNN